MSPIEDKTRLRLRLDTEAATWQAERAERGYDLLVEAIHDAMARVPAERHRCYTISCLCANVRWLARTRDEAMNDLSASAAEAERERDETQTKMKQLTQERDKALAEAKRMRVANSKLRDRREQDQISIPAPKVRRSPNGLVLLEWHIGRDYTKIEVMEDRVEYMRRDNAGNYTHWSLTLPPREEG